MARRFAGHDATMHPTWLYGIACVGRAPVTRLHLFKTGHFRYRDSLRPLDFSQHPPSVEFHTLNLNGDRHSYFIIWSDCGKMGEPKRRFPEAISYWQLLWDSARITQEVYDYPYDGSGSEEDPYIIEWIPEDRGLPYNMHKTTKWVCGGLCALCTLAVALNSSTYAGTLRPPRNRLSNLISDR